MTDAVTAVDAFLARGGGRAEDRRHTRAVRQKPVTRVARFRSLEDARKVLMPGTYEQYLLAAWAHWWSKQATALSQTGNRERQAESKYLLAQPEFKDLQARLGELRARLEKLEPSRDPFILEPLLDYSRETWDQLEANFNGKDRPRGYSLKESLKHLILKAQDFDLKEQLRKGADKRGWRELFDTELEQLRRLVEASRSAGADVFLNIYFQQALQDARKLTALLPIWKAFFAEVRKPRGERDQEKLAQLLARGKHHEIWQA